MQNMESECGCGALHKCFASHRIKYSVQSYHYFDSGQSLSACDSELKVYQNEPHTSKIATRSQLKAQLIS